MSNKEKQERKYACCFCGQGIGDSQEKFNPLDPCAIVLIGNWQQPEEKQVSQQFWCHLACFKNAQKDDSWVDLEDPPLIYPSRMSFLPSIHFDEVRTSSCEFVFLNC